MSPTIRRTSTPAAAFLAAAAGSTHAQHVIEPGALPGTAQMVAYAISADGSAVVGQGYGVGAQRAFRWTPSGGTQDLGTLPGDIHAAAVAVSADGFAVVGWSATSAGLSHAFLWTPVGGLQNLGTLPSGGAAGAAAISADGSVVAGWSGYPFVARAFRWTAAGGMQDLGSLSDASTGTGLSADGSVVVGYTSNDTGFARPLRWTAESGWSIQNLGVVTGGSWATAAGVSGDGAIVIGTSDGTPGGGFRWTEATGIQALPIAPGFVGADARAISLDGSTIIGQANPSVGVFRACLWTQATGMVNLNEYLPALGVNLDGWVLMEGAGISGDARAMVGQGTHDGVYRPYVVYLGSVPCYANCDQSTTPPLLNVADFGCFLNRFAAGDPYANCDSSTTAPVLNVADFSCFLNAFAAGCS
jgi:probable HAF family extracellular repeat protein